MLSGLRGIGGATGHDRERRISRLLEVSNEP
jgi:hypothetical protein